MPQELVTSLGIYIMTRSAPMTAIAQWETSAKLDASYTVAHRNLALAYFNKNNEPDKATSYFSCT
ncbi:hypothetical protein DFP97_104251 [Paenibacillus prosopidis]|uniref:Tetratricopeptide repeat protein n=1 Tax=Paenibacillus prosopidis TaxID=630520 RepID=A0A368W437_9BACL|nr:hypothetical protein DFP97_104251 [Paenibacillus prosopidis]